MAARVFVLGSSRGFCLGRPVVLCWGRLTFFRRSRSCFRATRAVASWLWAVVPLDRSRSCRRHGSSRASCGFVSGSLSVFLSCPALFAVEHRFCCWPLAALLAGPGRAFWYHCRSQAASRCVSEPLWDEFSTVRLQFSLWT